MKENDDLGETEMLTGMSRHERPAAEPDLDMELIKANVMSRLFNSIVEPTRIGRFALINRIGAGGMGEVYAAYDEQLHRKVAIKLVRPDAAPGATQRLLREAQVLARLSHPNVVQVYEVDRAGDRVFLAMEFIRGQTLRQWIAQQAGVPEPKRWRSVMAMFLAAGRGLQAAHAAGLVHRDFKPDNVLVGADGRVCVADFGLARIEHGNLGTDDTLDIPGRSGAPRPAEVLTRTGMWLGTPAYMSPEQWDGQPSDARSDQFSFCVALYEALYGERPFGAGERAQVQQRVLAGAWTAPPDTTAVPARIWSILQRGLAVAPADRYPDMRAILDELAMDPRQQWRRRVATALLLVAGAVAGSGVALHAASAPSADPCAFAGASVTNIWNPEAAARVHDAFAATGLPYATTLWTILQPRIASYAATLQASRKATCVATYIHHEQSEDIFDLQSVCLERPERHLQALRDQLVRADAATVERSAEAVAALPGIAACEENEDLVFGLQPPDETERDRVRAIRDELARARVLQLTGHMKEALELALAQLERAEQLSYRPARAEALHQLGILWREDGARENVARAEAALKQALDLAESHRHDELVNQLWLDLLTLARRHHKDFTLAQEWVRRALATSERLRAPGQQHVQRSAALGLRGAIHFLQGDLTRAEQDQRQALQLLAGQADTPPLARARLFHELASTVLARGRGAEARAAFEEALAIHEAELGDSHPDIARLSLDMAAAVRESGDFDRARELLAQALAISIAVNGPASLGAGDAHLALANLAEETGDLDVASEHAHLAREIYRQVVDEDSPRQAYPEAAVALVAFRRGRFADALAAYERALAAHRRGGAGNPLTVALLQGNIGEILVELGRPDEALKRIDQAEALLAGAGEVLPRYMAAVLRSRGLALLAKGQARAAIEPLQRALRLLSSTSGRPAHPLEHAETQWALARALRALDHRHERARVLANDARAVFQRYGQACGRHLQAIDAWLKAAS